MKRRGEERREGEERKREWGEEEERIRSCG